MKFLATATLVLLLLATAAGRASGVDDANAGLNALNRGDYATAVRLFSKALGEGGLSAADRELAFVKRGRAYLGEHRDDLARADLERALKLDPNDPEAANLLQRAEAGPGGQRPAQASNAPRKLGQFADWIAATVEQDGGVMCYAFTRAQSSSPSLPGRGEVLLTVTERPVARDTVALAMGFEFAKGASVTVQVDQTGLDFFTTQRAAYARDSKAAVEAFARGDRAIARSPGPQDRVVTDTFSLNGFSAAYEAIVRACPAQ